jgi:hypothetical protein
VVVGINRSEVKIEVGKAKKTLLALESPYKTYLFTLAFLLLYTGLKPRFPNTTGFPENSFSTLSGVILRDRQRNAFAFFFEAPGLSFPVKTTWYKSMYSLTIYLFSFNQLKSLTKYPYVHHDFKDDKPKATATVMRSREPLTEN